MVCIDRVGHVFVNDFVTLDSTESKTGKVLRFFKKVHELLVFAYAMHLRVCLQMFYICDGVGAWNELHIIFLINRNVACVLSLSL